MTDNVVQPAESVPAATGRRRTVALMVVLIAMFMDLLDSTIVNVALPPIQRDLGADNAAVQWVVAGYTLTFALGLITGGRLGDIFGRKRLFLIGVAGFTLASALCGAAQTPGQLIAARIIQGATGALMVPQILSIIQVMFMPQERGKAMAAFGGIAGLATVGGPVLGALLTDSDIAGLGWRSIFLVNVPIGVLLLVAAAGVVPESKATTVTRLDLPGVALVTLGLLMFIYPLITGRELGWPPWTVASMAGSLLVFTAFVFHQRRRTDSPLVRLSLFRYRSFGGGLAVSLLFMSGVIGFFLVFTIYLQVGLGFSVLRAGLTILPWGIAVPLFTSLAAGVLAPKLGRSVLRAGLVLVIVAMLGLIWTVSAQDNVTSWMLAPSLFIGGMGMGATMALLVDFTLANVPGDAAGSASGLLNSVQQVGSAIGIAAIGALYFSLVPARPDPAGFNDAFATTLWFPIAMITAALAATIMLPRRATHHSPR